LEGPQTGRPKQALEEKGWKSGQLHFISVTLSGACELSFYNLFISLCDCFIQVSHEASGLFLDVSFLFLAHKNQISL
jgi:hypothetical protein